MTSLQVSLASEADTAALGAALAHMLREGDIVRLEGDLGAGKTTLARGAIGALCGSVAAPSPTFTLVETYETENLSVWHFDLYRLEKPEDIWELGIEEAFETGAALIEWPDRGGGAIPSDALTIRLVHEGSGRIAELSGGEEWTKRIPYLVDEFENRTKGTV